MTWALSDVPALDPRTAVFDHLMSAYAMANDKRMWICKSMGMSKFHEELLEFYGPGRLRYIYLVRDVAMSFMKTPVGDCHYHAILTKWCRLQKLVIPIMEQMPAIIKEVRYEALLKDKQAVLAGLYTLQRLWACGRPVPRTVGSGVAWLQDGLCSRARLTPDA